MKQILSTQKAIEIIKLYSWELRVTRTGYLQTKQIANEAEVQSIEIAPGIIASYSRVLWLKDMNLYDDPVTKSFPELFERAFKVDLFWPEKQADALDKTAAAAEKILIKLKNMKKSATTKEKIKLITQYSQILKAIMKYYIIAVPLTNYAELKLTAAGINASEYGIPLRKLDISKISESKNPQIEYAWLKTAYNITEELTEEDIRQMKESESVVQDTSIDKNLSLPIQSMIRALQTGIYLRNRMKELCQKLMYYFEKPAIYMMADLKITRDDFYSLTDEEVIDSLKKGFATVHITEIHDRQKNFVIACLDGEKIIISGKMAEDLITWYSRPSATSEIKGNIACKGSAKGIAKLIFNQKQASIFKQGDILVTTMTTPDFVILMKKAAAIVTDEGGLSCHAAIVSRELNIPCIIGTKTATRLINNGDLVEVDANKGIVTVIKKNK